MLADAGVLSRVRKGSASQTMGALSFFVGNIFLWAAGPLSGLNNDRDAIRNDSKL